MAKATMNEAPPITANSGVMSKPIAASTTIRPTAIVAQYAATIRKDCSNWDRWGNRLMAELAARLTMRATINRPTRAARKNATLAIQLRPPSDSETQSNPRWVSEFQSGRPAPSTMSEVR